MPIPSRKEEEDRNKFMTRCMSDPTMKKEYKDNKQRVAVCMSQATENMDKTEAIDFAYSFEEFGYTEDLDEDNFYCPNESEYVTAEEFDFSQLDFEEYDISVARPGLWENIRKKREREGRDYKPAKPGDKDRPDPEAWKKAQSKFKYKNPKTGEIHFYERQSVYKKDGVDLVFVGKSAEYQGRKVTLNKPFRTPDASKKFAVYTKNEKGKVVIVRFGDQKMEIKRDDPKRRKSFRARHGCDKNPGPKWKSKWWSCQWSW